jgi:hypothetical protein
MGDRGERRLSIGAVELDVALLRPNRGHEQRQRRGDEGPYVVDVTQPEQLAK